MSYKPPSRRCLHISAIYCSPNNDIKRDQFLDFYSTLGPRFIAEGDYNAEHTTCGSCLINTTGKELLKAMEETHLKYLSTKKATYWPTDQNKIPDLIDFCITKGLLNATVS